MNVSVIMATYNGEKYIEEQLESIAPFLKEGDELIVSDDGSSDGTLEIVKEYQKDCPMIRITEGAHSGSSANFASAVPKCNGEVVLFCDQDDIWMPEKLERVRQVFSENPQIEMLMHNAGFCDSEGTVKEGDIFARRHPKHGFYHNLMHSTYYGCCMAAGREFLMRYVPIPGEGIPYDQYFSLIAEKKKKVMFLEEKLILHRYHGANQSKKMTNMERLKFRVKLLKAVKRAMKQ